MTNISFFQSNLLLLGAALIVFPLGCGGAADVDVLAHSSQASALIPDDGGTDDDYMNDDDMGYDEDDGSTYDDTDDNYMNDDDMGYDEDDGSTYDDTDDNYMNDDDMGYDEDDGSTDDDDMNNDDPRMEVGGRNVTIISDVDMTAAHMYMGSVCQCWEVTTYCDDSSCTNCGGATDAEWGLCDEFHHFYWGYSSASCAADCAASASCTAGCWADDAGAY